MNGIFINNYRGFRNTYFQLKKVNFFVGENSTGKTSLLKAINFILSPINFLSPDESIQNRLGAFSEIYSGYKNECIEFGVHSSLEDKNFFYVIKIQNKDDVPYVAEFLICSPEGLLLFHKPSLGYVKYFSTKNVSVDTATPNTCLQRLVEYSRELNKDRFQSLRDLPKSFKEKIIIPTIFSKIHTMHMHTSIPYILFEKNVIDIAPIRSCPQKTYDKIATERTSDGEHVPYLLKKILTSKAKQHDGTIQNLENYGQQSGLFQRIGVHSYGKTGNAPFALTVNMGKDRRIDSVGYGVSQILPILTDIFSIEASKKNVLYTIQQPEIHLHPKAQAALGDVFFQEAFNNGKRFCIETHSDYIIDRFRLAFLNQEIPDNFAQVLFTERLQDQNRVTTVDIKTDGNYSDEQPNAFREFFLQEQIRLFSL